MPLDKKLNSIHIGNAINQQYYCLNPFSKMDSPPQFIQTTTDEIYARLLKLGKNLSPESLQHVKNLISRKEILTDRIDQCNISSHMRDRTLLLLEELNEQYQVAHMELCEIAFIVATYIDYCQTDSRKVLTISQMAEYVQLHQSNDYFDFSNFFISNKKLKV